MESVFVFVPRHYSGTDLAQIVESLDQTRMAIRDTTMDETPNEVFNVDLGDTWLGFELYKDFSELYDQVEDETILQLVDEHIGIEQTALISIQYRSVRYVKMALQLLIRAMPTVVDNDMGTVLPGNALLRRMDEDPDWDWLADAFEDLIQRGLVSGPE